MLFFCKHYALDTHLTVTHQGMVSITLKCQETYKSLAAVKSNCVTVKVGIRDTGITLGGPTVMDFENFIVLEMVEIGVSVEQLFLYTYIF